VFAITAELKTKDLVLVIGQVRTETSSYTPEQNYSRQALNILLEGHEHFAGDLPPEIEEVLKEDCEHTKVED
jgi:hypothetical protein